jgi:hypothetical protein
MIYVDYDVDQALSNLEYFYQLAEVQDLTTTTTRLIKLSETEVSQITFFYPEYSLYLVIYLLEGSDGKVRFISVESSDASTLAKGVEIVEKTYSFTK